ncbi:YicC/YloC family endoribonuclease [Paeniroseomonas aquatica]|uniref:YicC/YloC family endoribonuclease n=1 Tax=Paeniroseomonas aquatica TaxID=373043 RepID=A0ABT8A133_9PROT|nr:YicC/YloC family endoribonuclease [Paeniroseomonas aquatica]MDN3563447.1 YicC/YloC family endoribonuclease [Paeniroseomonas aquatica]
MGILMSMTGFARESGTLADGTAFVWELRSVNGRGLDLRLRLPNGQDALEAPLREATGKRFKRGNISASLTLKREDRPRLTVDPAALDQALQLALELAGRIRGSMSPRAEALLALPGVMRTEVPQPDEALEETKRAALAEAFGQALAGLAEARQAEGAKLQEILSGLLAEIAALRDAAAAEAVGQPAAQRARMLEQLAALLGEAGTARIPEERLAQEVALLAQKSDVREELDRLAAHIEAAGALIAAGDGAGRKLDFLTQEFVREANTLCSKSASVPLTRIGLDLKAAIERLKEQAANVE